MNRMHITNKKMNLSDFYIFKNRFNRLRLEIQSFMRAFITVCFIVAVLPGFCQPKTDSNKKYQGVVFDVHLHSHLDSERRSADVEEFKRNKVVEAAITCSWNGQQPYRAL